MKFEDVRNEVKRQWRRIMPNITRPAKESVNGETSWICPICNHGAHGDGITFNKGSKNPETELICFGAGCDFGTGDIIRLYSMATGLNPDDPKDHRRAVIETGQLIGLTVDDESSTTRQDADKRPQTSATVNNTTDQENAVDGPYTTPERKNTPGLYREDCERWAADIDKTTYLQDQGITPEIAKRFRVGYDVTTNQIVYPYNMDFSYWIKRKADKSDKQYRKPKTDEAGPEPLYNPTALYSGDPVFICEGAIDALSIVQAGGNAAAIIGTGERALMENIKRKAPAAPLVLWLDYDLLNDKGHRPGQEEQSKLAKALQESGTPYIEASYNLESYGVDHADPNDLLQINPDQFAKDVRANIDRAEYVRDIGPEMADFLQTIYSDKYKPIPTGIDGIDKLLHGGMIRQTLTLLGARPGAGKTILAQMIGESFAKQGQDVIYICLEMSRAQLIARSLSRIIYTELHWKTDAVSILQGYNHDPEMKKRIEKAARIYARDTGQRMKYNPFESSDLDEILQYIEEQGEKAKAAGRPGPIVIVDYLHLLTNSKKEDQSETIKRAVTGLKSYAVKYDSIVIAIEAQNRTANDAKTAVLSGGRDSSNLEYSGDLVLSLVTGKQEDPEHGDPDSVKLYVIKSRFTAFDIDKGLEFIRHGGQSYFEQVGNWNQLADNEPAPDFGKKKGKNGPKQDNYKITL